MEEGSTQRLEEENRLLKSKIAALTSELKKKETLQRKYEDTEVRFRTVFEESALGNKFINSDLEIIRVNKALLKLLGYSKKELLGTRIMDISHPDYVEHWQKLQYMLWTENRRSFSIDTCIRKKDKTFLWCHVTSILFKDKGETLGYTIIEDVSERKTLEHNLKEANTRELQFQQQLLKSTIDAQEKERLDIAEDVHDSLAQLLYGIKLSLDQIDLQSPEAIDASDIAFDEAKRVLSRCIKECRRISNELMPSALEYFGLVPAIEDLCKQVKGPIDLKSNITGLHGRLPKYLEVVIYRIVQELTKNVVKHAAATKALINVSFKGDEVTIKVEDNGVGFSAVKVPDGRSRIRSIDNKLHLLKGKLHTARVPGGGTLVSVQFSIKGLVA